MEASAWLRCTTWHGERNNHQKRSKGSIETSEHFSRIVVKSISRIQLEVVPMLGAPGLDFETWDTSISMVRNYLVRNQADAAPRALFCPHLLNSLFVWLSQVCSS
jgi:hypothetical protein